MTRVKICGNKRLEDALEGVRAGADALGFLVGQVHTSSDFISKESAKEIIEKLPPYISTVLVTHLSDVKEVISLAEYTKVTTIQLHGDSAINDVPVLRHALPNVKLYKAIHVIDHASVEEVRKWENVVDAILLDTISKAEGKVGGTGKVHDWGISAEIVKSLNIPVILAGGLNPDNVCIAIEQVHPYAVDVNSGTKAAEGYKDFAKLHAFVQSAKSL